MAGQKVNVQWKTSSGNEMVIGDTRVTPQARALTIRWPFGGLVWNMPAAVLIERDGRTERIPIVDVTRVAQAGLLVFFFVFLIASAITQVRMRRDPKWNETQARQ